MTPERQRQVIAEARGWTIHGTINGKLLMWPPDHGDAMQPPDYPSDLNAMHEAEKALDINQLTTYLDALDRVCVPVHICSTTHAAAVIMATAAQRAEALLRALNRWEDTP